MSENDVKYKKVDKWVYGEEEIKLIGEDNQFAKGMYYFIFWINITINNSLHTLAINSYLIGLK